MLDLLSMQGIERKGFVNSGKEQDAKQLIQTSPDKIKRYFYLNCNPIQNLCSQ